MQRVRASERLEIDEQLVEAAQAQHSIRPLRNRRIPVTGQPGSLDLPPSASCGSPQRLSSPASQRLVEEGDRPTWIPGATGRGEQLRELRRIDVDAHCAELVPGALADQDVGFTRLEKHAT